MKYSLDKKIILLVEDNPDDELLTIRALKKNYIMNEMVVARDGSEPLDYLFGTGDYADRDMREMSQVTVTTMRNQCDVGKVYS